MRRDRRISRRCERKRGTDDGGDSGYEDVASRGPGARHVRGGLGRGAVRLDPAALRVPFPGQIRRAVAATLQRLGVRGCTEQVAGEFGDHPDSAVARMSWALATIHTVYPAPPRTAAPDLRPLAFAS